MHSPVGEPKSVINFCGDESDLLTRVPGGGSQYVQWRLGQGAYGPNGKRASDRTCEGVLQAGDSYKLAFDNAGDM